MNPSDGRIFKRVGMMCEIYTCRINVVPWCVIDCFVLPSNSINTLSKTNGEVHVLHHKMIVSLPVKYIALIREYSRCVCEQEHDILNKYVNIMYMVQCATKPVKTTVLWCWRTVLVEQPM